MGQGTGPLPSGVESPRETPSSATVKDEDDPLREEGGKGFRGGTGPGGEGPTRRSEREGGGREGRGG